MADKRLRRPASTGPMKRPRTGGLASDCKIVSNALLQADHLPQALSSILSKSAPFALSDYAEDRHANQAAVVKMVEEALKGSEKALTESVADIKAKIAGRETEFVNREAAVLESAKAIAATKVDAAHKAFEEFAAGKALTKAEAAKKKAEVGQRSGDKLYSTLAAKRAKLESIKEKVETMKAGSCPRKEVIALEKEMKPFQLDETLMSHLYLCLTKAPAALTEFEQKMIVQLDSELALRSKDLDEKIAAEEPGKKARAEAMSDAAVAHGAAKVKSAATTAATKDANKAIKAALKDLKNKEAAVSGFDREMKATEDGLVKAERKVAEFQAGPLATFMALKQRAAPPPEPEKEAPVDVPDVPVTDKEAAEEGTATPTPMQSPKSA